MFQAKKRQALETEVVNWAKLLDMFVPGPCAAAALTIASSSGQSLKVEVWELDERKNYRVEIGRELAMGESWCEPTQVWGEEKGPSLPRTDR